MPTSYDASRKSLHRYARKFYMTHHREHRTSGTGREHFIAAAISGVTLIYVGYRIKEQLGLCSRLSAIVLLVCAIPLLLLFLRSVFKFIDYHTQAAAFADDAVDNASNFAEVEAYFDNTYPLVFYRKH